MDKLYGAVHVHGDFGDTPACVRAQQMNMVVHTQVRLQFRQLFGQGYHELKQLLLLWVSSYIATRLWLSLPIFTLQARPDRDVLYARDQ